MSKDNSDPAFPVIADDFYERGMTLRDYFAGQALAGYSVMFPETCKAFMRGLLCRLGLYRTWDNDKWFHPLYRRSKLVRYIVWKLAGQGVKL